MSLSVYVHFPWCLQKCPYCDFASGSIQPEQIPHAAYADAILRELETHSSTLAEAEVSSVFFGGGTPSLWAPKELGRVLAALLSRCATVAPDLEVTVECNPSSLNRSKAAALAQVGVNRLSVGVQSLDAGRLRFLGRLHDAPGALRALQDAQAEVKRVSGDLMFGMPGQSTADFMEEVRRVADLGLSHMSVYALTIEPETQFGALHRKGRLQLAPEETFAEAFAATQALLGTHGYGHYEISNYAQTGEESRHNQHYWRAGSYLGLGAGAVGCLRWPQQGGRRYRNDPNPQRYMTHADQPAREISHETLAAQDTIREGLMLGLRTSAGVHLPSLGKLAGVDPRTGRQAALQRQVAQGNLLDDGHTIQVPQTRWLHLDSIVAELF